MAQALTSKARCLPLPSVGGDRKSTLSAGSNNGKAASVPSIRKKVAVAAAPPLSSQPTLFSDPLAKKRKVEDGSVSSVQKKIWTITPSPSPLAKKRPVDSLKDSKAPIATKKKPDRILHRVYQLTRPVGWAAHEKELTLVPLDPHQFGRAKQRTLWYMQECKKLRMFGTMGDRVCVPPQYGLVNFGEPDEDRRPPGRDIDLKFQARLWGPDDPFDQGPVTERLQEWVAKQGGGGVIELPTSSGKTVVILNLITRIVKKKALIVVPMLPLLSQTVRRIEEFIPGARVGIIHSKKREIKGKDIVVAMLHSLVAAFNPSSKKTEVDSKGKKKTQQEETKEPKKKKPEKPPLPPLKASDFDEFGVVLYDEIDRFCTRTFKEALVLLAHIRRMFGFSATPKRPDGMDRLLTLYLGPFIYRAPPASKGAHLTDVQRLTYAEGTQTVIINPKTQEPDCSAMCEALHADERRTEHILYLLDNILAVGRRVVVLVTRIEFGKRLVSQCAERNPGKRCIFYSQQLKAHERAFVDSTPHDLIVASYGIFSVGVDVGYLDTLLFASPRKTVKQAVGRLRSISKIERKSLMIIDLIDTFSFFRTQAGQRKRVYGEKGFTCLPSLPAGDVSFLYPDSQRTLNFRDFVKPPVKADNAPVEPLTAEPAEGGEGEGEDSAPEPLFPDEELDTQAV